MQQMKELRTVSDYETSIDLIPDIGQENDVQDGTSGDDQKPRNRDDNRICCFIRIDRFSPAAKFFICSGGIFGCFMIYGYVQEMMFRIEGYKDFGWYLTLMQFLQYTLFSFVERKATMSDMTRKIPVRYYLVIGFLAMATIGLSNVSLAYLNYPTQVVFKCCKLIPVLIGGVLIQGKKYGMLDILAAVCMSIGLIFFVLADNKVQPNFNMTGVLFVCLALTADAAIGNIQEKAVRLYHGNTLEVVYFTHLIGAVYVFAGLLISGEFFRAFTYCYENPKFYAYAALFGATGYIGVQMVLTMVVSFGAFIAMSVTTFRKALSIVISFLAFSKPFTLQYLWAGGVVLLGVYLNVYSRNQEEMRGYMIRFLRSIASVFCIFSRRRHHNSKQFPQVV